MLRVLDKAAVLYHGAAALGKVRARLLHGKPPDAAELFESIWQMLTRLSWAVADRVVRSACSYPELARDAAAPLLAILRSRGRDVPHFERWIERHEGVFWGLGAEIAEYVDQALDFPLGVVVDVDVDRRGRLIQRPRALRTAVPEALRPTKATRKRRALVPDERVTARALDAIAATVSMDELRAR